MLSGLGDRREVAREEPNSPGRTEEAATSLRRSLVAGEPASAAHRAQGAGQGRGYAQRSTPDAARRTRRRLGPVSGRRACQSLLTFANHGVPRMAVAHRSRKRAPGGVSNSESFRADSAPAPPRPPCPRPTQPLSPRPAPAPRYPAGKASGPDS